MLSTRLSEALAQGVSQRQQGVRLALAFRRRVLLVHGSIDVLLQGRVLLAQCGFQPSGPEADKQSQRTLANILEMVRYLRRGIGERMNHEFSEFLDGCSTSRYL